LRRNLSAKETGEERVVVVVEFGGSADIVKSDQVDTNKLH
jgi:hypothetical protein